MTTPEGAVKQAIRKVLIRRGLIAAGSKEIDWVRPVTGWFFMPVPSGLGVHGIPDFIGTYLSHFIAIEAKAPGEINSLSANQKRRLYEMNQSTPYTCVADTPEIVEALLDAIENHYADRT